MFVEAGASIGMRSEVFFVSGLFPCPCIMVLRSMYDCNVKYSFGNVVVRERRGDRTRTILNEHARSPCGGFVKAFCGLEMLRTVVIVWVDGQSRGEHRGLPGS